MNFKPKFENYKFNKISVDNFIEKFRRWWSIEPVLWLHQQHE